MSETEPLVTPETIKEEPPEEDLLSVPKRSELEKRNFLTPTEVNYPEIKTALRKQPFPSNTPFRTFKASTSKYSPTSQHFPKSNISKTP